MTHFSLCLEAGAPLFKAWFAEVVKDSSIFAINIARVMPMLEVLPNAQNPKFPSLNFLQKLDSIYDVLGFFIEDTVEDRLLTDQVLQAIKSAVKQVFTFRQCSFECLKLTNVQEDHQSTAPFPPFQYYLFRPYHEMVKGQSQLFSGFKCYMPMTGYPCWLQSMVPANYKSKSQIGLLY